MANVMLKSGEGRCPSLFMTTSLEVTGAKLVQIKNSIDLAATGDEVGKTIVFGLISTTSVAAFVAWATGTVKTFIEDKLFEFLILNGDDVKKKIDDIAIKSTETYTVTWEGNCINKGLNGHYYAVTKITVS